MTVLTGTIQKRHGTAAQWVTANPTLLQGEEGLETDTRRTKTGNGSTEWNDLAYDDELTSGETGIISGGGVTVVSDDATVAAATYFIEGEGTFSSPQTAFNNIALSSAGTQRFVAFYGNTSSTVDKVEGAESALAVMPNTPADSVLLGYILVTDAAVSETPDLSGYLLRSDKATSTEVRTGTNDTKYITPLALKTAGVQPRSSSVASSATPSINTDLYDCYSITALAVAITSFTTNLTGTPVNFQPLIIRIKDNGTARAITWGASFVSMGETLPTTTVISKVLIVAFLYDSVLAKWGCVGVKNEA